MSIEFFIRRWFIQPINAINGFIFVSRFNYEQHLKVLPQLKNRPYLIAHNAIDTLPESAISKTMGNYYLYFGRLSPEKGLITLINTFNSLPHLQLKIVGEGPQTEELKKIANRNIEFCGYQSGDTLRATIRDCKAIIVPSECYENNPMTIIEASMAGIPTIGARIGGIPEIIVEGKTGYIFTSKSVSELTEAVTKLEALSAEQYQAMSLECRKFADEKFSSRALYEKIIKFYTSILESYES